MLLDCLVKDPDAAYIVVVAAMRSLRRLDRKSNLVDINSAWLGQRESENT